ncbi:MAG: glyoxalase [Peptococcaceae bacterium]|nr:glyoxalase [Peptococcaceae bacterium]
MELQQAQIIVVTDMERSIAFYKKYLNLDVEADDGDNVTLTGGISLQSIENRFGFVCGMDACQRSNVGDLYFEEYDFDEYIKKLADLELVRPPMEHPWGQRVIRFYDPDGYSIEVGESITAVVRRFADSGMTIAEIADRMDVEEEYVQEWISL